MAEGRDVQWVEVTEGQDGQRVDNFLMTRIKGAPRALIYRIVRKGEVRVNKKRVKPDTRLAWCAYRRSGSRPGRRCVK